MLAFGLVIVLLAYLGLLGTAIASVPQRNVRLTVALITPAMGLGAILPPALFLSRLGLPMLSFGTPLLLGLGVAAAAWLAYRRPRMPWTELRPLAIPLAIGSLMAGVPLLLYGFNWAGNSNGDMGIYLEQASNFLHHGFFYVPHYDDLVTGYDSPQALWYWEMAPPNRFGTDAYLGVISAALHIQVYKIYMACSVAGFISLMMAIAALSASVPAARKRMVLSTTLVAVACPLLLFTVYQQILPQLLGDTALVALVALLQLPDETRRDEFERVLALAFVYSGLSYIYPEITPLLGLGLAAATPFVLVKHRTGLVAFVKRILKVPAMAAVIFLALVNVQLFTLVATLRMLAHIGAATTAAGPGVINYYLIPSGIANMWGFMPFDAYNEPGLSIAILAGFLLFVAVGIASVWSLYKYRRLSDAMAVGLQAFCVLLFFHRSAYVLFKMIFLWQPFAIPVVAAAMLAVATRIHRRWPAVKRPGVPVAAMVVVAVLATSFSTYHYLGSTTDSFKTAEFTALHNASRHNMYGQMQSIADAFPDRTTAFRFDGLLPSQDEMAAVIWRDHPIKFESLDPFIRLFGYAAHLTTKQIVGWPQMTRFTAETIARHRNDTFSKGNILIGENYLGAWVPPADSSTLLPAPPVRRTVFIETGPNLTILNRDTAGQPFDVRGLPIQDVKNWLVLVDSDLGPPPQDFVAVNVPAAIGPIEPDPLNVSQYISTLGKGMLLEVVNAGPTVRLRLDITATLNPRAYNAIPAMELIGKSVQRIPSIGTGSARFITPPIVPAKINGRSYVGIRFDQPLIHFDLTRTPIMGLFGNDIDLDIRRFTLYARNISVATQASAPPSGISNFPQDLSNTALEYSGVYEDGWLGGEFKTRLHARVGDRLHMRVEVPPAAHPHDVYLAIDGKNVATYHARPATYLDVVGPPESSGDHAIDIQSASVEHLLKNDPRPTWGRLMDLRLH